MTRGQPVWFGFVREGPLFRAQALGFRVYGVGGLGVLRSFEVQASRAFEVVRGEACAQNKDFCVMCFSRATEKLQRQLLQPPYWRGPLTVASLWFFSPLCKCT